MTMLSPGFTAPDEAQNCFRAVLRAFSHPGEIVSLTTAIVPPPPLSVASAAILLTLAGPATPVSLEAEAAQDWLVFHTGARLVDAPYAEFVVARTRPALAWLNAGTDDEPEMSATLILEADDFAQGRRCRLTGPGIESSRDAVIPLDDGFFAEWAAAQDMFPRGVDVLVCAGRQIMGLPRSVRID